MLVSHVSQCFYIQIADLTTAIPRLGQCLSTTCLTFGRFLPPNLLPSSCLQSSCLQHSCLPSSCLESFCFHLPLFYLPDFTFLSPICLGLSSCLLSPCLLPSCLLSSCLQTYSVNSPLHSPSSARDDPGVQRSPGGQPPARV